MNTKQMGIKPGPALVTALLWAAMVLPFAATSAVAQKAPADAKTPQINVAEPEHDFGEVWYGPKLEHTYKITNTGTAPLDIINVKPSCGCTKKGRHPKSIAPGETGEFAFTLDTKKLRNAFNKTIRVTTNDPDNKELILKLKGVVKRYVDVEPISASFGKILGSEPRERELKITNNTDKTLELTLPKNASDGKFSFELTEVEAGKSFLLRVSTKPPYSPGRISKKIKLATNVKEQPELNITVAGIVPERIEVKPSPLIISKTTRRIPRQIQVTNYGDTPVKILDATIDEPGITLVVEEREAGKSYRIKVNLPQGYTPPAAGRTIVLKTDDPEKPEIRIAVKAPRARTPKKTVRRPVEDLLGKPAPAFELVTLAGEKITNKDGKVTVLNFFAPNCGYCKKQIPRLDKIRQQYEDKGVRFINVREVMRKPYTVEATLEILEKTGSKIDLAMDSDSNTVGGLFKARGFPTMVVLGKTGKVEYANVGNVGDLESRMRVQLDSLLDPTKPRWKSPTPAQQTAKKPKSRRPVQDLVGKPAPSFSGTTLAGKAVSNSTVAKEITVLNFFAGNCGFCKKQIPRLDTIRKEYESKGVRFINVSQSMRGKKYSDEEIVAIVEKTGAKMELLTDPDNKIGGPFKAVSFPTMVILGKSGKVEYANVGNVGDLESRMKVQLDSLLDPSKPRWVASAANTARPKPTAPTKPALQLVGKPIPLFRALTIKDKPVTTTTAEDEVTVLNFFASNCPHCKRQIPRLEKIRQEFEGKGVRFVNICQVMRGQTSSDDEVVSLLKGLGAKSEIVNDPRNK
ncbi:MAG: redoxin domain-containing protein, partial [Planctomycetes bacterium]|nr:redoxin domain-containing protein [Planctomycetota bacterium]